MLSGNNFAFDFDYPKQFGLKRYILELNWYERFKHKKGKNGNLSFSAHAAPKELKNKSFPVADRTKTAVKYTESELRSCNACKNTSFVVEVKLNLRCSCRLP